MFISEDTLKELEFYKVLEEIATFSYSNHAKEKILASKPKDYQGIIDHLYEVNEYLSSFYNNNSIPFGEFEPIDEELKILQIENYYLKSISFLRIRDLSKKVNSLIIHFENYKEYFPTLYKKSSHIQYNKEIILAIDKVFNRFGEIKNDASDHLKTIRKELQEIRKNIQENFDKSRSYYSQAGLLDEILESVIDDQRVLAVKSSLKRQVKGRVLGFSKTGSICFIIPESVVKHYVRLLEQKNEEEKEIEKILAVLTYKINEYYPLLKQYQKYVYSLDIIQAKSRYAKLINGVLPQIQKTPIIELIDAYHPLLLIKNRKNKSNTISQSLSLNQETRIICISGPNAGGKSITLKTVGLLQLMLQSGILIPVNPKSSIGFFNKILTDIGDNQSIENHLSTYSSRLKKMKVIIDQADNLTLLLIDEFGTGSDPELGGALAESFLEFFYEKESFGIITTHYTNIKIKIEELPHSINAAMLFNRNTLLPIYKLEIGHAGSSFTFEVAEKNKIPKEIIKIAREKVESDKVSLDNTLVKLQQQKFQIEKLKINLNEQLSNSSEKNKELSDLINNYKQKLINFQKLYDEEKRLNLLGQKIEKMIFAYSQGKSKKELIKEFSKLIEQEIIKNTDVEKEKIVKQRNKLKKELKKEEIKEELEEQKIKEEIFSREEIEKWYKEGRRVRIKGSSSSGTIQKIENNTVFLNYGNFITQINISQIEKV